MIMSLYENHFPVRFGVILYSSKFIKNIEINGGKLHSPAAEDDSSVNEDISSLVFSLYSYLLFFLVLIYFESCAIASDISCSAVCSVDAFFIQLFSFLVIHFADI